MKKQADAGQLSTNDRVTSCPVDDNGGPGVAGAGVAIILQHLITAEKLALIELNQINNNGATEMQKQLMASALVEIGSAIVEVSEAEDEN